MNLQSLNSAQIAAVTAPLKPTIVLAGAGSGKTRVLTNRILYLIQECGVSPSEILAITFTNKAANEMKRRLFEFNVGAGWMHISTIHSFCATVLRYEANSFDRNSNFTIYAEDEKKSVIKKIVRDAFDDSDAKVVDGFCDSISDIKNKAPELLDGDLNALSRNDEYLSAEIERLQSLASAQSNAEVVKIIETYNKKMAENNALDFDDLLYYVYKLFANSPEILEKYRERYKYILIDEFQDTNKVQYNIFRMLGEKYGNIFVVGDDDQSIYSWRGAEANNLKKFQRDFPDCQVFKLEQNYRSTKAILDVANQIISLNTGRFEKVLWTENEQGVKPQLYAAYNEADEAYFVVEQIKGLRAVARNGRWKDFAILMRINALSRSFEAELTKNRIPYKVFGGFKFFERKEIKDVLSYMRLVVNPDDTEAFIRALNVPRRRGIGDTTIKKLLDLSADRGLSVLEFVSDERNLLDDFNRPTREKLTDFYKIVEQLDALAGTNSVKVFTHAMLDLLEFRQVLLDADEEERALNIDEFEQSVIDFEKAQPNATLGDYLQSVTLASDIDEDSEADYVSVATIHAVKGLEFKNVFVIGLEDGIFPTSRATYNAETMQEERRLMYVAVTRAEQRLYLTRARTRFLWGQRKDTMESRYFSEIKRMQTPPRPAATERQLADDSFLDRLNNREPRPSATPNPGKTKAQVGNFKPGMKVEHAMFGKGIILRISGDVVDVAFDTVGKKSLMIKFAPLKILE